MAMLYGREPAWIQGEGPAKDVALASRVRLARNLARQPFPARAGDDALRAVAQAIKRAARAEEDAIGPLDAVAVRSLESEERAVLLAAQRVSPDLLSGPSLERWALLDREGTLSVLINEEDHLRIQALCPGAGVAEAVRRAESCLEALARQLNFAADERWGYLTASLSNVGTGMRASVLVHLPAMALRQKLGDELAIAIDLDTAVRGLRGEGSEARGDLYQISNRVAYGRTPRELLDRVQGTAEHLIAEERTSRRILGLLHKGRLKMQARAVRDLLHSAAALPPGEAYDVLSTLRLAAACEVLTGPDEREFAHLVATLRDTEDILGQRANIARAAVLRDTLRAHLEF